MNDLILRLPARDAQRVLLVYAVEEDDRSGDVLPFEARREATAEATEGRAGQKESRWLPRRARLLADVLAAEGAPIHRRAGRALSVTDPRRLPGPSWLGAPILVLAFLSGLATHALGPERHVNLLAPPLLGLVAWNLAVFAGLAVRRLAGLLRPSGALAERLAGPGRWGRFLGTWMRRSLGTSRGDARNDKEDGEDPADATDWRTLFLSLWLPCLRPLAWGRVRRLLHLAALLVVAGVVTGMYLRGLVLAYRATWESTFLDAGAVEALLSAVLGPVAALLGVEIPAVGPLERPLEGPAAPWIHLWAAAAVLYVGLPRLWLASLETLRIWRLSRRVEIALPGPYPRRLLASASSSTPDVQVLPYSYRPRESALRSLRSLLLDLAGARARVRVAPVAEYGSEAPQAWDGSLRVILFTLAQTPELEVHGELLREVRSALPDGQRLLVLVDAGPYRRRLGEAGAEVEARLAERRRAWKRIAEDAELSIVPVDLESSAEETMDERTADLERMSRAVFPAAGKGSLAWSR